MYNYICIYIYIIMYIYNSFYVIHNFEWRERTIPEIGIGIGNWAYKGFKGPKNWR